MKVSVFISSTSLLTKLKNDDIVCLQLYYDKIILELDLPLFQQDNATIQMS